MKPSQLFDTRTSDDGRKTRLFLRSPELEFAVVGHSSGLQVNVPVLGDGGRYKEITVGFKDKAKEGLLVLHCCEQHVLRVESGAGIDLADHFVPSIGLLRAHSGSLLAVQLERVGEWMVSGHGARHTPYEHARRVPAQVLCDYVMGLVEESDVLTAADGESPVEELARLREHVGTVRTAMYRFIDSHDLRARAQGTSIYTVIHLAGEVITELRADVARLEEENAELRARYVQASDFATALAKERDRGYQCLQRLLSALDWERDIPRPKAMKDFDPAFMGGWLDHIARKRKECEAMRRLVDFTEYEVRNALSGEGWFARHYPSKIRRCVRVIAEVLRK